MSRRLVTLILAAGLLGCRGESRSNPLMGLMAEGISEPRSRGSLMAFRLPAEGGDARLYHLPAVAEESWRFDWGTHNASHVVGFSAADHVVYALTSNQNLISLDLETGRTRLVDSAVALAVMDAADRTIVARMDGSIRLVDETIFNALYFSYE